MSQRAHEELCARRDALIREAGGVVDKSAADELYAEAQRLAPIVAAYSRLAQWRTFAPHTNEEREAHAADMRMAREYETTAAQPHTGADPMGDE